MRRLAALLGEAGVQLSLPRAVVRWTKEQVRVSPEEPGARALLLALIRVAALSSAG